MSPEARDSGADDRAGPGDRVEDYDYPLPAELIAQQRLGPRADSRLMYMPSTGAPRHLAFRDLGSLLRPGDLLVVNDTRVIPARVRFEHLGREAEILLLHPAGGDADVWECLVRPGRRMLPGMRMQVRFGLWADVLAPGAGGGKRLRFSPPGRLAQLLPEIGEMPLPPYIHEPLADPERYQTVYAREPGSAAAPTAGLHFDEPMLAELAAAGVARAPVTLRIGLDTFQPLRVDSLSDHRMHSETYEIPPATRQAIDTARANGGRIVAVGTTVARALEAAAAKAGAGEPRERADSGATDIFLRPGHRFREVDMLLTNFHLPRSTLLVLVSAFAGRERILDAYRVAVAEGYRFYSFGDAMLLGPIR
ncbi:MAG: tRNA preQ1(34) S-adenosylmethionine ribosyltransferase-isomerase QueA [Candidatus Dormibacteria bacterium]